MRKMPKSFRMFAVAAVSLFAVAAGAEAAGTLVPLSSAAYNGPANSSDYANAVAVDGAGRVIVAGNSMGGGGIDEGVIIKYDPDLAVISSVTYSYAVNGKNSWYGVAADASGNVIAAGYRFNGSNDDLFVMKYDANLVMIASATYNGDGDGNDTGNDVALDGSGNIIVTGYTQRSNSDICTIKYDANLNVLSSATFNGAANGTDQAAGVAVDGSGNIIVVGKSSNGSNLDYIVLKYSPALVLISSATYNGDNKADSAYGVAVDAAGNIIVTGESWTGTDSNCVTVKYTPDLTVISSATYNYIPNKTDSGAEVLVDPSGYIIVAGYSNNESNADYFTVKYDADLHMLSSARYNGAANGTDFGLDAAVDGAGNIFVTGSSVIGNADFFTIKYNGNPVVSAVTPASGAQGKTVAVTITGSNFLPGAAAAFSGSGITVDAAEVVDASQIRLTVTIAADAALGKRDVTVTNADGIPVTKPLAFTVDHMTAVTSPVAPENASEISMTPASGEIRVAVPAGTFGSAVNLTVRTAAVPVSDNPTVRPGGICLEIFNDLGLQPQKNITVTVRYRDADVSGLDESQVAVCRYDAANNRWIPLPSTVDVANNTVTATIDHLSTFVLAQLAASGDLAQIKAFPVPFNPARGAMTISGLTGTADIKIFTAAGELVRTVPYTSANGRAAWDGRNDAGSTAASGVYILLIKSDAGTKRVKIAVER